MLSADLLVFPDPLAQIIREQIVRELKVPPQAVVITATHTHSGSGAIAKGFLHQIVFGAYQQAVVDGLIGRMVWAARQAVERQELVQWGSGERLFLQGLTENRMVPSGSIDPTLSLFLVESFQGKPVAVLVNCAAHPTLLDSKDMRFSADYPGELTRVIEASYPGVVCLFENGTAGDLRPRDSLGSTPEERIHRFGEALAEGAIGLINQMSLQSRGDLAAWGQQVALPRPEIYIGRIPLHPRIGRLMRPTSGYVNLFALDRTLFVPLPAEMTAELGQDLRRKLEAQGFRSFLLGYADSYLGYAVTPRQYESRSYEAWMTWYGSSFGAFLVEKIRQLSSLYPREQS